MNTLHIITGAPGAGKTTYGRELANQRAAAFLDIDTVTETMVRAALEAMSHDPDDRDSPFFKRRFREPIYETLFRVAEDNLTHGDVVLTGPFTKEQRDPNWLDGLSRRFSCRVLAYHLSCPPEIRRQRLVDRGKPRDQAKLAAWESFLEYYGEDQPPAYPHRLIETA